MKQVSHLILLLCSLLLLQQVNGQKNDKNKIKKLYLLPVYLTYSGLPLDTSTDRMVKEAFERHKVKLIGKNEFEKNNYG